MGTQRLTKAEAIARLDALRADDPEAVHSRADEILLDFVPPEIRDAYHRVEASCRWWAFA